LIRVAVIVAPLSVPVTRIVSPTVNCCAVAGLAAVPNLVEPVIVTVMFSPALVVTTQESPLCVVIRPLTPLSLLRLPLPCGALLELGALLADGLGCSDKLDVSLPQAATPSPIPAQANAATPNRSTRTPAFAIIENPFAVRLSGSGVDVPGRFRVGRAGESSADLQTLRSTETTVPSTTARSPSMTW
jgi:hypothetical protein